MFKNKANEGKNNICGTNIRRFRLERSPAMSQRMLAEELQRHGLDVDKMQCRESKRENAL